MCGRYTLSSPGPEIAAAFGLDEAPALSPRYNIAPTQSVPVVRATAGGRMLAMLRWGLVPAWAKDISVGNRMINARAESAAEKPAFREAMRRRRCLLPADGFYEWLRGPSGSQPHRFHRPTGEPFGMAGLWEEWTSPEGELIGSCTILTTEANALVRPIHDRMPVVLDPADFEAWLDPGSRDARWLAGLLVPCSPDRMVVSVASRRLNDARHEGPDCLEAGDGDAPAGRGSSTLPDA